jgi:hypothetical protein
VVRIAVICVLLTLAGDLTGCGDNLSPLPRCTDLCPMGPHDAWLCTRNPDDGIERCACAADDNMPEPCEGDL